MKKIISILLLTVYLFSATDLKEMLKAGVVVQHFQETKESDKTISFLHFLVMHYITDDNNTADNDRDTQLPFKSHDTCLSGFSLISITGIETADAAKVYPVIDHVLVPCDHAFILIGHQNNIWRPPQIS